MHWIPITVKEGTWTQTLKCKKECIHKDIHRDFLACPSYYFPKMLVMCASNYYFSFQAKKMKDCASNGTRQPVNIWDSMSLLPFFIWEILRNLPLHDTCNTTDVWNQQGINWTLLEETYNLNSILMSFSSDFLWASSFKLIIKNDWQMLMSRILNRGFSNCSLVQQTSNIRNKMWK